MKGKKGQQMNLGSLPTVAVLFVVGAIVLGFGAKITSDISADLTANTTAKDAVENGTKALDNVAKQMPLLGTIVIAALIIGLVVGSFTLRRRG